MTTITRLKVNTNTILSFNGKKTLFPNPAQAIFFVKSKVSNIVVVMGEIIVLKSENKEIAKIFLNKKF